MLSIARVQLHFVASQSLPLTERETFAPTRLAPIHSGSTQSAATVVDSLQLLRDSLEYVGESDLTSTLENLAQLKTLLVSLQETIALVATMKLCDSRVQSARGQIDADVERMRAAAVTNPWGFIDFLKHGAPQTAARAYSTAESESATAARSSQDPTDPGSHPSSTAHPAPAAPYDGELQTRAIPPSPEAIVPEPFDGHEQELHEAVIDLNFRFDPDPVLSSELPPEELRIPRSAAESNDSPGRFEIEAQNPVSPEVLEEIVAGIEQQNLQHQIGTQEQSSAETPDFDKKLLDDLIRNYGEFVASPQAQPIAKEFDGFERAEPRREFAASGAPAPVIHAAVVGQNSQHELDREIKKIIKDYGAVDLYSMAPASRNAAPSWRLSYSAACSPASIFFPDLKPRQ